MIEKWSDEWLALPDSIRAEIIRREVDAEKHRESSLPIHIRVKKLEDEFAWMSYHFNLWPTEDLTMFFKSRKEYDNLVFQYCRKMEFKLTRYRLGIFG